MRVGFNWRYLQLGNQNATCCVLHWLNYERHFIMKTKRPTLTLLSCSQSHHTKPRLVKQVPTTSSANTLISDESYIDKEFYNTAPADRMERKVVLVSDTKRHVMVITISFRVHVL